MANEESSPTVGDCRFTENQAYYGGGISSINGAPMVMRCLFDTNAAPRGGGMYTLYGNEVVANCIFYGNTGNSGAGIEVDQGAPTVTRCAFNRNKTTGDGGAISTFCSKLTLAECTLGGNKAYIGGAIYNYGTYAEWCSNPTIEI